MTNQSELKPHRNNRELNGRKSSVSFYYFGCGGDYLELLKSKIQKKWSSHFDFHLHSKKLRVIFKYFIKDEETNPLTIDYLFTIKGKDLVFSVDKEVISVFENACELPIEKTIPHVIKGMEENFGFQLEKIQDIKTKFKKFISLINRMCKECNVKVRPLSLSKVSIEEMYSDELNVKFDINGVVIEELIDFNIKKSRLYMLKEMLKIKSSLTENVSQQEIAVKKRI